MVEATKIFWTGKYQGFAEDPRTLLLWSIKFYLVNSNSKDIDNVIWINAVHNFFAHRFSFFLNLVAGDYERVHFADQMSNKEEWSGSPLN